MKNLFSILFIACFQLLLVSKSIAQDRLMPEEWKTNKGNSKIQGEVINPLGEAVEFSAISLFLVESNQLVDGTITDEKGKFELKNLGQGKYRMEISFLGFDNIERNDILIGDDETLDLGQISMLEKAEFLNEVTVTAEKSLIEEQVDRMVYNASKDILSRGGDASDVLRKVPLLQVDLEGNISLRGNSNIRVLINNKPSTIMAANVADALKMIPAEMIDKVEVITSPSAKYDAEGGTGIINIITKKNNIEGEYLQLNTGIGLRGSNLGLNGSYRKGNFGMTLGGFGRAFYNDSETDMTQLTNLGTGINETKQSATASDNGMFGRYSLGFDYDIDKTQFLSGGIRYGLRDFSRDQLQTTQLFSDDALQFSNLKDISSERYSGSWDLNIDYLKIFKPQTELSISTLYSRTSENSNFISDNLTSEELFISSLKNIDDNLNREITLQADFSTSIGKKQKFEIGTKAIFRMVNSDFSYQFAEAPDQFVVDYNRPSGSLDYDQDVVAAYSTYTLSMPGDFTLKAGLRWERTLINALQNNETIDLPDYQNLVPSFNLSKKLSMATTIKLGFNQRIQRPWLRQLNPNVNLENSQFIQVGNPNLRPELTNNLELGLSTMIQKTYLSFNFFGRSSDNAITNIRYPSESGNGVIVSTFENLGQEKAIGLDLNANINFSDKFSISAGINSYYLNIEGQVQGLNGTSVTESNSGINYGGRLMSQLKLTNGWGLQAFSFMHGTRVELQGSRGGFGMYALGFNKEFNNKKGSLGLSVENFASRGWNMKSELNSALFTQINNNLMLNRSVRVNFTYRFGKMDIGNTKSKTRSVNNNDLMGGGDGGGEAGGAGAPAATSAGNQGGKPAPPKKTDDKNSKKPDAGKGTKTDDKKTEKTEGSNEDPKN